MKSGLWATALAVTVLGTTGAEAATSKFDLFWTSTSGTSTTDSTMQAVGFLEVAVGAGELFGLQDLVSIDVDVSGDTINDFSIDGSENTQFLEGQVSADGTMAILTDFLFANFIDPFLGNGFGCDFADTTPCEAGNFQNSGPDYNIVSGRLINPTGENGNKGTTTYDSAGSALASISLTEFVAQDPDPGPTPSPVPLPASAPLLIGALGGLALWQRRRKRA